MARSTSTCATARLHATTGDDTSTEQRAATSPVRSEGKPCWTVDRASLGCCCFRWCTEGITWGKQLKPKLLKLKKWNVWIIPSCMFLMDLIFRFNRTIWISWEESIRMLCHSNQTWMSWRDTTRKYKKPWSSKTDTRNTPWRLVMFYFVGKVDVFQCKSYLCK